MYVCVHSYNQSSHIKHVFNPFTCMSVFLFVCLFTNRLHVDVDGKFISIVSPHIPHVVEVTGNPSTFSREAFM